MIANKIKPFLYLGGIYVILSFILRIILINHPITSDSFSIGEFIKIISVGFLNDILVFVLVSSILALYFLFLSNSKYKKPYGNIIFGLLLLALIYTLFIPNNIFKQYGGSVAKIAGIFIGLKTALFGLLLFLPEQRIKLRNILYYITLLIYVLCIVFTGVSEYFFWNEFGVRYNFIAVDYLIYTNEVIGNIMESYPVAPLFSVILIVSVLITTYIYKKTKDTLLNLPNVFQKIGLLLTYCLLFVTSLYLIPQLTKFNTDNNFGNELQANGLPKFYDAFVNKELDFNQFYPTMATSKSDHLFFGGQNLNSNNLDSLQNNPEHRKNVVLISVESLSADFLEHYGNTKKITPFIDSLAQKSLLFTNLYATGNRTVRGLEALTLCIPPTAGESVVKRKDNKDKFSVGSVFKSKGYQVKYLYGGYSYFDNMKDFFGGNGYDIVDRDSFKPNEITFANVWGVCDQDMAKKAIQVMNEEAKTGKPFFNHWMTVSNHRPFTYPEGKIDISGQAKSRDGGVKYTDYALKQFFAMAKKQSWYKNTVFVIVADHCASSAGKTELPLEKYRIPGMIFSEGFIEPEHFDTLMSQIDVMPTLLGLLNFQYESKFFGKDVKKPNYEPRAYIATYQDLGLIKNDILTLIKPIKKIEQYNLKPILNKDHKGFQIHFEEELRTNISVKEKDECIAAYQTTSNWLKEKKFNK